MANTVSKEIVIEAYLLNKPLVVAEMLYDTITKYESRVCGNCRYWEEHLSNDIMRYISYCSCLDRGTKEDFGCNKFKEGEIK